MIITLAVIVGLLALSLLAACIAGALLRARSIELEEEGLRRAREGFGWPEL